MARDMSGFADHPESPTWSPDGYGNQSYGGEFYGKNAYDKDVDRYRAQGVAAQGVAPVALDQTQANESRGMQLGALGMLRAQAEGSAPSAAGIMSQRANQGAATAGGHAALGGIAALRNAQPGIATQALAANAQNANARGAELSRGQGQYASAAGSVEGQDIGAAEADARLAAQQRAVNEQRQQYMERQAQNTQFVQHQNAAEFTRQQHAALAAQRAYQAQKTALDFKRGGDVVSMIPIIGPGVGNSVGDAGQSGPTPPPDDTTGSDERMKMHVGSLANLRRRAG